MIIFGFRTRSSLVGVDQFRCPACRAMQRCRIYRQQRWFTLYFLPLLPLGRAKLHIDCLHCGGVYPCDVLTGQADASGATLTASKPGVPRNSMLATISLMLGAASVPLLPFCGSSLLTSLAAIVSGHAASHQIRRSAGQLSGRGMARIGLGLGYCLFAATLALWGLLLHGFLQGWQAAEQDQVAEAAVDPQEAGQALHGVEMN